MIGNENSNQDFTRHDRRGLRMSACMIAGALPASSRAK
jgi:hypothetical protein